ncbi:hypothetical protein HUW46_06990 [Amycolatopsis sp. CA-230715]|nr:hypothetical protein HUW46_06990 [Amycolatopsis sp. CA-230715]
MTEPHGLGQVLKTAGAVVAPTTVLTALLFYFGRLHAYWFFYYFGVNSTVLGLSTQDYLVRSADGLFVPLAVLASIGLAVVWLHRLVRRPSLDDAHPLLVRIAKIGAVVLGLFLTCVGVLNILRVPFLDFAIAVPPFSFAFGVLLLMYASRRRATGGTRTALAEWAAVFVLVSLSLFWFATDYSAAVGTGQAHALEADLAYEPDTVLYSERSLSLRVRGVTETPCHAGENAYKFRYDGLKLVLQSGDQYLFLPAGWHPATGSAILIPRAAPVRLEFSTAGRRGAPAC